MKGTLLSRWLRGWVPGGRSPRRRVRVPVVAKVENRAEVWTLEVRGSQDGPGGLVADPRMPVKPDAAFADAIADAYSWAWARDSFPRHSTPPWTITWCLLDDTDTPAEEVKGGSLGAAFGVALAYLFGLGVRASRRLDPHALVSAGLDATGHLTTVEGLETKVRALGARRARLMVADADKATALDIRSGEHPDIGSGTKAVDALTFAQAPRYKSAPAVLVTLVLVAAVFVWTDVQRSAAAEAQRTRLAQQLAAQARQHLSSDPAAAALAAVAAVRLRPGEPEAQASLVNAALVDTRFDRVVVQDTSTMAVSPDGMIVASGGDNHSVTLTGTDRARSSRSAQAGGARVVTMAFSRDGQVLVTGDDRGTVVRWDIATLTPSTLHVATGYGEGPVRAVAVNMNGSTVGIATQLGQLFVHVGGTTTAAYGLRTGTNVTAMVFISADTLAVAAIGRRGTQQLSIVDTARIEEAPHDLLLNNSTSIFIAGVSALAASGDGQTLISGDTAGSVVLWDTATLTQRKSLSTGRAVIGLCVDMEANMALITTTRSLGLTTSVDLEVGKAKSQLWDLRDDEPRSAPLGGDFRTALVSADRELRAAAVRGADGGVTWWTDLDSARMRQNGIVADIVPDPHDDTGVITAGTQGRIDFVDVVSGRISHSFAKTGPETLYGLAIDRTGKLLATAHSEGTVLLRDRDTGALRGNPLKAGTDPVYRVAFSPTADILATGSGDGTVRLWEASSGQLLRQWSTGASIIHQVLFDATGERVYVADSKVTDLEVVGGLWWVSTDSDKVHDRQDSPYQARGMALTADGNVLIGSGDGTLALTDDRLHPLPTAIPVRHRLNVLALAYSAHSGRVITASADNKFMLLRTDLSLLAELPGADADSIGGDQNANGVYAVAVTGDGRYAVVGGHGGRVQVVPLASDLLVERACHLAGRGATNTDLGVPPDVLNDMEPPC